MFILNFHGIGECIRPFEKGEEPYWISRDQFLQCLDIVDQSGIEVNLTFDDGNASDHDIALPILQERGKRASFFVLAGKVGQSGYLSVKQVQAIDNSDGYTIGSHGLHHQAWPDLDDSSIRNEIYESKLKLEVITGHIIEAAGLPFGRYDRRTLKLLRSAGYTKIYSSDGGPRLSNLLPVPRFSVRCDTDMSQLSDMIMRSTSFPKRLRTELRAGIKSLR